MKKSDLRATCLAKQKALSPADRAVRSDRIAEAFFRRFDLCPIRVVHIFIPIEKFNEVDTRLIIERLWTRPSNERYSEYFRERPKLRPIISGKTVDL
jgi:5-formyltetrahydrofolate cyclo-ligase